LRSDLAAADAAFQGREMGAVRRDHERGCHKLTFRGAVTAPAHTTKNQAPCDPLAGGFLLLANGRRYSMPVNGRKAPVCKSKTHHIRARETRMPITLLRLGALSAAFALLAASSEPSFAQKKYDTGATDSEIKIGNIMPYSGPASAYGVIGKTEEA